MSLKFVIVAGPPSSGKTSVMVGAIKHLINEGTKVCACKIDCLNTSDSKRYKSIGIPAVEGLSDYICPDHFYVANLEEIWSWAKKIESEVLVLETAGLCHRCAPAVEDCLNICVVDNLSGLDTPHKIGPMLSTADIIAITKGDIVSQAEREVFQDNVESANQDAGIIRINGLTGQGTDILKNEIQKLEPGSKITGKELKYPMPAAICSYCAGETIIGQDFLMGNLKKIDFGEL